MKPDGKDGLYTERQLWQFYVRFNEVYFSNTLPLPRRIAYVEKLPLHCADAVACTVWEGASVDDSEYRILFLKRFFGGRHAHLILCSLLHEMVHIYVHRFDPARVEGHGPAFSRACRRLQQLGWNVSTNLIANARGFEPRDRRSELSSPATLTFLPVLSFLARLMRRGLRDSEV